MWVVYECGRWNNHLPHYSVSEKKNDENLLVFVIDDKNTVKKYQNQFNNLRNNKYNPGKYQELLSKTNVKPSSILETTTKNTTSPDNKIININTASLKELDCLFFWGGLFSNLKMSLKQVSDR